MVWLIMNALFENEHPVEAHLGIAFYVRYVLTSGIYECPVALELSGCGKQKRVGNKSGDRY